VTVYCPPSGFLVFLWGVGLYFWPDCPEPPFPSCGFSTPLTCSSPHPPCYLFFRSLFWLVCRPGFVLLVRKTPPPFLFSIKSFQGFTHSSIRLNKLCGVLLFFVLFCVSPISQRAPFEVLVFAPFSFALRPPPGFTRLSSGSLVLSCLFSLFDPSPARSLALLPLPPKHLPPALLAPPLFPLDRLHCTRERSQESISSGCLI